MAIIATGTKTIIDLSDGKSLSVYLGSNQPRTQVYDTNNSSFAPNWATPEGKLVVTPVIYVNHAALALNAPGQSITWKRREGSAAEVNLTVDEAVLGNVLTVTENQLASITSGLLTYIAYVTYVDPDSALPINAVADISFAMVKTGANAKSAWISGEQVFKYASGVPTPAPAQIMLTAVLSNVTMGKWQYKNGGGSWEDYPTTGDNANITSPTLIVKPTHAIWVGETAALRITTSDSNIGDTTSIYKVSDGANGSDGTSGQSAAVAFLTNENVTFAGNASGQIGATSVTCNVVAYQGTAKVTPTVGTISGMPIGMTATKGSPVNSEIPITITIAASSTLGAAGALQGTLLVPVTEPVNTTLSFTWSKVNTGASGSNGQNAVLFSLYAPNGTVFTNQQGSLLIQTSAYDGATSISSGATYVWAKYSSGTWANISGQTGANLTVNGSDVVGLASFRCTMTYGGKTYQDVITLIDRTDNYQAVIDSMAGDIFRNTVGETVLICRLWQNGTEQDALKSTTISAAAPSSPATGQFYYRITKPAVAMSLMRYSGSAWVDVTNDGAHKHAHTYKWYRRNKDGEPLDSGAAFASGKTIFVNGDHVDEKTVFVCEVE